jgi:hypothetical protein
MIQSHCEVCVGAALLENLVEKLLDFPGRIGMRPPPG